MFVEDKTSYNGPIALRVNPKMSVAELKDLVHCEFEIPIGVQKWILGKSLVDDETSTLASHGISKNGQKIFLYLVAPGKASLNVSIQCIPEINNQRNYKTTNNVVLCVHQFQKMIKQQFAVKISQMQQQMDIALMDHLQNPRSLQNLCQGLTYQPHQIQIEKEGIGIMK